MRARGKKALAEGARNRGVDRRYLREDGKDAADLLRVLLVRRSHRLENEDRRKNHHEDAEKHRDSAEHRLFDLGVELLKKLAEFRFEAELTKVDENKHANPDDRRGQNIPHFHKSGRNFESE